MEFQCVWRGSASHRVYYFTSKLALMLITRHASNSQFWSSVLWCVWLAVPIGVKRNWCVSNMHGDHVDFTCVLKVVRVIFYSKDCLLIKK